MVHEAVARLASRSSSVLRVASVDLSGSERLLGETSRSRETREQMRQRLVEEGIAHFLIPASVALLVTLLFLVAILAFFFWSMVAAYVHWSEPCDEPLRFYTVAIVVAHFNKHFVTRLCKTATLRCICLVPLCLMVWGLYMVESCKTCPQTNPELYYPTRDFIYLQFVMFLWFAVVSLAARARYRNFRLLLEAMNRLSPDREGCEKAVHELPKVPHTCEELVDAEDGEIMDCCICSESLATGSDVVRTLCDHFFHEDCLSTWCKNHTDCPLCRKEISDVGLGV